MKIPPHPIAPAGVPNGAYAWAQRRGLDIRHPERWDAETLAAYELELAARPPCRSPYLHGCGCHITRWLDPHAGGEFWDDVSEEEVKAWVAADPFVRGGFAHRTAQAFTFLETFRGSSKIARTADITADGVVMAERDAGAEESPTPKGGTKPRPRRGVKSSALRAAPTIQSFAPKAAP